MAKCLVGLRDKRIVLVDMETSKKAMRQAINADCDQIFVAEFTEALRSAHLKDQDINIVFEVNGVSND